MTLPDASIHLRVNDAQVPCKPGQVVLEALQSAGLLVQSACSGRGACHLCRVLVCGGQPSPRTPIEQRVLQGPAHVDGERLACQLWLVGSLSLQLLDIGPASIKKDGS